MVAVWVVWWCVGGGPPGEEGSCAVVAVQRNMWCMDQGVPPAEAASMLACQQCA